MSAPSPHGLLSRFILLNSLAGLSVGVAKVVLALYAIELEASPLQLGLIAGAQSLGILLMSLPAGVLVDQHGPLRLFAVGTTLSGSLYLYLSQVHSTWLLCLVVLLISCFMPLRIVALSAMLLQQINRIGTNLAGWVRATHMLGMFLLAPPLSALLVEQQGFATSYLAIGLTFYLLVLMAPSVLRHYQQAREHARALSLDELRSQLNLLRHEPRLPGTCLRELCIQAANQFFGFFIMIIAIRTLGFNRTQATLLITLQGSSYIFALLVLGRASTRLSERHFLRLANLLAGTALLMLGSLHSAWGLGAGALLLGLGLGMLQIVNMTSFARIGMRHGQGRIAGLSTFVGPAGSLAGGVLGGWLGQWIGLQPVFLLLAAVFLLPLARRISQGEAHG